MMYEHLDAIPALVEQKLVNRRVHPTLPLWIHNYSAGAQYMPVAEWSPAMCDCRGLVLDRRGCVVARPFRKFWNYEQVLHLIPSEPFTVWEKMDGSLGVVSAYQGQRIFATRGSFESDQARWATAFFDANHPDFIPQDGLTYLFEIVYPENRIVVDYGGRSGVFMLAVLDASGKDHPAFEDEMRFEKARRFDGITDYALIESLGDCPEHRGSEGFVLRWESGFRAKVKFAEYKRLHRLITQCSTRTIWELLRDGKGTAELIDHVPEEFKSWVETTAADLNRRFEEISLTAMNAFNDTPGRFESRKDFAEWAKQQPNPGLLFALLDGKPIEPGTWKLIEPKWAPPYRSEAE